MKARVVLLAVGVMVSVSGAAGALEPNADSHESKAVRLSDAELDNVTAGGSFSIHVVSNPGNASRVTVTDKQIHIVEGSATPGGGSSGFMFVQTKKHTVSHFRP